MMTVSRGKPVDEASMYARRYQSSLRCFLGNAHYFRSRSVRKASASRKLARSYLAAKTPSRSATPQDWNSGTIGTGTLIGKR